MTKLAKTSVLALALFGGINFAAMPPAMADDDNEYEKQFSKDDALAAKERYDDDKYDKDYREYTKKYWTTIKNVRDPCNKKKIDVLGKTTIVIRTKYNQVLVTYNFETKPWSKYEVNLRGQKKFAKANWDSYIVPIYGSFEKDHGRDATEFDAKGYAKVFSKQYAHYEPRGEQIYIKKVRCDDDKKYDPDGDKDGNHGEGTGGDN